MFVYAIALPFKANHVNIMFGNIKKTSCLVILKKQFTVCVGLICFMLKPLVHTKAKSCFSRLYQVN